MEITESSVASLVDKLHVLKQEIGKKIFGQEATLDQLIIAYLAGGHALLEGVPGLAKTLMVKSLSEAIDLSFHRIQFTPDLMPSDIVGTEILEEDHTTGKRFFKFNKGPVFAHIVLADEINRTPPKTQAALLEAMQEHAVTYGGTTYKLPEPFFILATQNPIEQSGTFPLPEAQLDRFMLYIRIAYPTEAEEAKILTATTSGEKVTISPVMDEASLLSARALVKDVHISPELISYVNKLVRATRPDDTTVDYVKKWARWGAGPRAGQALILCAKANAFLKGRLSVIPEDIYKMTPPVLRHRVLMNFKADAEGITADDVCVELLKQIKATGNYMD